MYPPAFTTQSAQNSLSSDTSPRKIMFVSGGWLPLIVFHCLLLLSAFASFVFPQNHRRVVFTQNHLKGRRGGGGALKKQNVYIDLLIAYYLLYIYILFDIYLCIVIYILIHLYKYLNPSDECYATLQYLRPQIPVLSTAENTR